MLWLQARAGDFSRAGSERRRGGLPVRLSRTSRFWLLAIWLLLAVLCLSILTPNALAQSKGRKGRARAKAAPSASPGKQIVPNIPLPIGHEAKGLVLPDFDGDGHLRGKFEAGTAHRIDQEHVGFEQLKITTYTPEDQPDLKIDMSTSVLDLKTRI